jgi:Thrombospondin type 3 repeat
VGIALALAASPATAAPIHVGELPPASSNSLCVGPLALIQVSEAPDQPSYVAPVDGLIVRWRVKQDSGTTNAKLQTFHPTSTPNRFVAGPQSAVEAVAPGLNSYAANVPVRKDDRIGVTLPDSSGGFWCGFPAPPASNNLGTIPGDPSPGTEVTASPVVSSARLNLDVFVEPDNDADSVPDESVDGDDDNDGLGDGADNCPLAPNPSQRNTDGAGDGGDACDPDDDNDSARDDADNCPTDANGGQEDADLGGGGDACDSDDDNDGLSDPREAALGTVATDADSDDDGLGDAAERRTSPARSDTDRDGLPDGLELGLRSGVADPPGAATGTDAARFRPDRHPRSKTNPLKRDTDRDRLRDGREDRNRNGRRNRGETDPRRRDSDGDRVSDGRDRRPLNRLVR